MNNLFFFTFALFLFGCKKNVNYSEIKMKRKFGDYASSFVSLKLPVSFSSKEGLKRLHEAKYSNHFYNLINFYSPQVYPVTCGPAALKMVLHALYKKAQEPFPLSKKTTLTAQENGLDIPHFTFTEENIFDNIAQEDKQRGIRYEVIARQAKDLDGKYGGGISPVDLTKVANSFPIIKAEYFPVTKEKFSETGYQEFKKQILEYLQDENLFVIINYHLGIELPISSGHYSPIVAFEEKNNSVLILNTMNYYGEWNWVDLKDIYSSMYSVLNGFDRGFIAVSLKEGMQK